MSAITLNELWTQMVALVTTQLGIAIVARVPVLAVDSIPPAVIGGVVLAALLLVFFTTLGLSARLLAVNGCTPLDDQCLKSGEPRAESPGPE